MTWFRVDDSFRSHPKVRSIPRSIRLATVGVWTLCGDWCAQHLTDGHLPADSVEDEGGKAVHASALVRAGLWHATGHDCERCPDPGPAAYQFHDWADYQPTRESVLAERKAAADRMRKAREKRRGKGDDGEGTGGVRPNGDPNVPPNSGGSSSNPDPTRPDPSKNFPGSDPSSSSVPEREPTTSDGPTTDEIIGWTTTAAPDGVDLAVEAAAFQAINAGRWSEIRNRQLAWHRWLAKAAERNRPTPTPGTPPCPRHPDQPTGSKACSRCAAEDGPPPASLRELRDGHREAS